MHNLSHEGLSRNNSKLVTNRIVFSFMAIQFLAFFYYGGFKAIFPFILEYMEYSEFEVIANWAFIFSFGLLIGFFTRMPMGIVADKISRKNSLILGTLICSISVTSLLFTTDVLLLALIFGAIRTGTHLFPLLARGYVSEVPDNKHGRLNGFMLISANIAGFVSPIVLTFLLNVDFLLLIIFSNFVLYSILVYLLVAVPKKTVRSEYSAKYIFFKSIKELVKFKNVIFVMILIGLINGINNYILVPYALYVLKLPQSEISFIIGSISITNILFIFASGELLNKFGVRNMIYIGLTSILIGTSLIITSPLNIIVFTIGEMFIAGGVLLNINASVTLVTLRASMETASTSFGGVSSFFFLGSALIPYIAKELYVIDQIYPFYLIIVMSISFYFVILILNIQKRRNNKIAII